MSLHLGQHILRAEGLSEPDSQRVLIVEMFCSLPFCYFCCSCFLGGWCGPRASGAPNQVFIDIHWAGMGAIDFARYGFQQSVSLSTCSIPMPCIHHKHHTPTRIHSMESWKWSSLPVCGGKWASMMIPGGVSIYIYII